MAGLVIGCPAVHLSLVSLLLYSLASTTAQHMLGGGSSLSVQDRPRPFLVSSDGTFSCGFLQVGDNAFSFSVWFTASRNSTTIWNSGWPTATPPLTAGAPGSRSPVTGS
ncbi:hypothetical protein ABZP36_016095 [Zizania latifolia]